MMWSKDSANEPRSWDSFSGLDLQQLLLCDPHNDMDTQRAIQQQSQLLGLGSSEDVALGSWGPRSGLELDLQAAASQLQFYESLPQPLSSSPAQQQQQQHITAMPATQVPSSIFAQNMLTLPQQSISLAGDSSSAFFPSSGLNLGGVPNGWAGHRVVAVQGEIVSPATVLVNLDSGEISQVPQATAVQAQQHQPMYVQQSMTWLGGAPAPQARLAIPMANAGPRVLPSASLGQRYPQQQLLQQQQQQQQFMVQQQQMYLQQQQQQQQMLRAGMMRGNVRAAAPSWAPADWNPMRGVQAAPRSTPSMPTGTGVFLPRSEALAQGPATSAGLSTASMAPEAPAPATSAGAHPASDNGAPATTPATAATTTAAAATSAPKAIAESVEMEMGSSESMTDAFPVSMLLLP